MPSQCRCHWAAPDWPPPQRGCWLRAVAVEGEEGPCQVWRTGRRSAGRPVGGRFRSHRRRWSPEGSSAAGSDLPVVAPTSGRSLLKSSAKVASTSTTIKAHSDQAPTRLRFLKRAQARWFATSAWRGGRRHRRGRTALMRPQALRAGWQGQAPSDRQAALMRPPGAAPPAPPGARGLRVGRAALISPPPRKNCTRGSTATYSRSDTSQ